MPQQQIKFTIRQDGLVSEEVLGVVGDACQDLTKSIEEKLGEVTYIETKPEFYSNNVSLQRNQDQTQEQTTITGSTGDTSV